MLFPSPGGFPSAGIEPVSLTSPALEGKFLTTAPPGKPFQSVLNFKKEKSKRTLVDGEIYHVHGSEESI